MSRSKPSLSLPQYANERERDARQAEVDGARREYAFDHAWTGYPPSIAKVPAREKSPSGDLKLLESGLKMASAWLRLHFHRALFGLRHVFKRAKPFEAYRGLYGANPPMVAKHDLWRQDEMFAAQKLNGMYPWFIERLDDLAAFQKGFPIDDERVAGLLPAGATLADLEAHGRLYVIRQDALRGAIPAHGHVMTAPTSLFFVDNAERLMPLGIQMHPNDAQGLQPVLTPNDDAAAWLGMKIHASCADAMVHAIYSHLILLHFVMCNVWTAANRTLPSEHPVHAFLKPHFWSTLQVTSTVKGTIDKPDGLLCKITGFGYTGQNQMVAKMWERFDFARYEPSVDFEARGIADPEKLPHFYYRDDALALWDADLDYVRSMMDLFYARDEDVRDDFELQRWVAEMACAEGGCIRGLPTGADGQLETREQLHRLLTCVLFTVTSRHSSTENGALQFVYPPANPFSYRLPVPLKSTDQYSLRTVSDCLPSMRHAMSAKELIQAADFDASKFGGIGRYPEGFTDPWPTGASDAVSEWQQRLQRISQQIADRNEKLQLPYTGLDPKTTYNSIWN